MKKSADLNSDKMKAEFRRKLENYKATPSENLWDKIELSLDKEEALVYKNRFRVYSRLAAACLALLIAFAVIFVPRKWEQLENQQAEIAAANTAETNKAETKAPVLKANPTLETKLPEESLAVNAPDPKYNAPQRESGNLISEQEKTPGSQAQKVPADPSASIAVNSSQTALAPGLIAAISTSAKQADPVSEEPVSTTDSSLEEVTLAAVSPVEIKEATSVEMPKLAQNHASEAAETVNQNNQSEIGNSSGVAAQSAMLAGAPINRSAAAKIMSPEAISYLSQTRNGSFSDQNPSVSETAKTENSVAFTDKKEDEIPQAGFAQAQEPAKEKPAALTEEKSEEEKKASEESGRWMVSGSYAALSFNSGIRLAGRSFEPEPPSIGSGSNYNQNLSNYQTAIQEYNHETSAAYSQKGGVMVGFKMAKKWLLQTGFSYFQNREKTNSSYVFARKPGYGGYPQPNISTDSGTPTTLETVLSNNFDPARSQVSPASDYTTLYSYQYYSVPLNLRFQTGEPGIYFFAGAGGAVNFLDQTTVEIEQEYGGRASISTNSVQREKATQPDVYRNSLLSVQLETGLGYSFSSHWSAEFALTGNHYLKPLIREEQLAGTKQQTARSFGASLNLGYTF